MFMLRRAFMTILSLVSAGVSACIPYAVATTATPVAERATTLSATAMPSIAMFDSAGGRSWLSLDTEARIPINDQSDAGFRVVGASGVVVNYKRLLTDSAARVRVAVMPGFGFVNFASHAHFEATLLISGYEPRGTATRVDRGALFVPYGGLRVMQVAPLSPDAVHDTPTAGGFLGLRIGSAELGVSPEVGVFYDHSALGVRRGNTVVVPSLNVHGDELIRVLRQGLR
jgi:hypothetical protein